MAGLPRQYIRYEDGSIEEVTDVERYAAWFNDSKNRFIDRTAVPYGNTFKKAVIVSTYFLGFEHDIICGKPVLWETLAQLPDSDNISRRYVCELDAREGHEQIVHEVQARITRAEEEIEQLIVSVNAIPVRRPRKIKNPKQKTPDPNCQKCGGSGEDTKAIIPDTPCDCTRIQRKKNAPW